MGLGWGVWLGLLAALGGERALEAALQLGAQPLRLARLLRVHLRLPLRVRVRVRVRAGARVKVSVRVRVRVRVRPYTSAARST